MSLILAVDPNVLIAVLEDDHASLHAIQEIVMRKDEMSIALDSGGEIWREYMKYEKSFSKNGNTHSFVKLFFDTNKKKISRRENTNLTRSEQKWLNEKNCKFPVEPELIAVGKDLKNEGAVLVNAGSCTSPKLSRRGTDDIKIIEEIQCKFAPMHIWPTEKMREISWHYFNSSLFPGNEDHLIQWLKNHKYEESDILEFKQPGKQINGEQVDITILTNSIIKSSFEAVCAMLNNRGGTVAIGINKDKKIVGIDPELNQNGEIDDDKLSRKITTRYNIIKPSINTYVKPSIITLSTKRRVILLHVRKCEEGVRFGFVVGKKITYFDRCGSSNRVTKIEYIKSK